MRSMLCALVFIIAGCTPSAAEHNNRANDLVQAGDFDRAIIAYQAAQVSEPDNALLYFNAATALAEAGNVEGAIAALEQAILRGDEATIALAYYNMGNIFLAIEAYEEAVFAYQDALRRNPNNVDARHNLEYALLRIERPTPTAIEMQTNLDEEQVNPTEPPTPNPGGQELPTPTPTPPEALPPPGTPEGLGNDEEGNAEDERDAPPIPQEAGELSVEDAADILEQVEADQERISTFRDNYNLQGTPETDRDW